MLNGSDIELKETNIQSNSEQSSIPRRVSRIKRKTLSKPPENIPSQPSPESTSHPSLNAQFSAEPISHSDTSIQSSSSLTPVSPIVSTPSSPVVIDETKEILPHAEPTLKHKKAIDNKQRKRDEAAIARAKLYFDLLKITEHDLKNAGTSIEKLKDLFHQDEKIFKGLKYLSIYKLVMELKKILPLICGAYADYLPNLKDQKLASFIRNFGGKPSSITLLLNRPWQLAIAYGSEQAVSGYQIFYERWYSLVFYLLTIGTSINYFIGKDVTALGAIQSIFGLSNREKSVAEMLSLPYVSVPFFVIPFLWAFGKGSFAFLTQWREVTDKQIERAVEKLKNYRVPGITQNIPVLSALWDVVESTIRWILPLHPYGRSFRKLFRAMVYDGRVKPEALPKMLDAFSEYEKHVWGVSRGKFLYAIMDLANAHSLDDIKRMRTQGHSIEKIIFLLNMKLVASELLRKNADSCSSIKNILSFIYTNYLKFYSARFFKWYFLPLFLFYTAIKWYGIINMPVAVLRGLLVIGDQLKAEAECEKKGGHMADILETATKMCIYCPDSWPVYYAAKLNAQDCLNAYLNTPSLRLTSEQIVAAYEIIKPKGTQNITFSQFFVQAVFNETGFKLVFDRLSTLVEATYLLDLTNLNLKTNSSQAIRAVANFIEKVPTDTISLRNCGLTVNEAAILAPGIAKAAGFKRLILEGNKLGKNGTEILMPILPFSTQELNLNNNGLGDSGVTVVAKYLPQKNLTALFLANNNFGVTGMTDLALALAEVKSITTLDVNNNNLGVLGITALANKLANMRGLTTLTITTTGLNTQGLINLASPLANSTVAYLYARANFGLQNDVKGMETLGSMLKFSNLVSIDFSNCAIGSNGFKALAKYFPESKLINLVFPTNNLNNDAVITLAENIPPFLSDLVLGFNPLIGDSSIQVLVPKLPRNMRYLHLSQTNATDASLLTIARECPSAIEDLRLATNKFTLAGLQTLINSLHRFTKPYDLYLGNNQFGDKGLVMLAEKIDQTPIRGLIYENNGVTAEGIKALAPKLSKTSHLKTLYIALNRFGDEGIIELAKVLTTYTPPPNQISWLEPNKAEQRKSLAQAKPATKIDTLNIRDANITALGASALCRAIGPAGINVKQVDFALNPIDAMLLDPNTCRIVNDSFIPLAASSGYSHKPSWLNPYASLAYGIIATRNMAKNIYNLGHAAWEKPEVYQKINNVEHTVAYLGCAYLIAEGIRAIYKYFVVQAQTVPFEFARTELGRLQFTLASTRVDLIELQRIKKLNDTDSYRIGIFNERVADIAERLLKLDNNIIAKNIIEKAVINNLSDDINELKLEVLERKLALTIDELSDNCAKLYDTYAKNPLSRLTDKFKNELKMLKIQLKAFEPQYILDDNLRSMLIALQRQMSKLYQATKDYVGSGKWLFFQTTLAAPEIIPEEDKVDKSSISYLLTLD